MTQEFFKEFCKHIKSELLPVIPYNSTLYVYRGLDDKDEPEYLDITCAGWKYIRHRNGSEEIQSLEGHAE